MTNVKLRGDDLQHLQNKWIYIISSTGQTPDDGILETLCSGQVKLSVQFKQHYVLYQNGILNSESKKAYYKLHQVVERYLANVQNERNRRDLDNAHYHSPNSKNKSKENSKGNGTGKNRSKGPKIPGHCTTWMLTGAC